MPMERDNDIEGMRRSLREAAMGLGAEVYGTAPAEGFLRERYTGGRPQDIMSDVRSVVVVGVPILGGSLEPLPRGRPEYTNSLLAATVTLRYISYALARRLERAGYRATIVPAEGSEFGYWYVDKEALRAGVSLRYAAYLAGLGRYGLSQNLITDQLGPRVRFMGIVTDAPLADGPGNEGELVSDRCRSCRRCIDACPVGALGADGTIDRQRCRAYMFDELGGLRCGMCLKACPWERDRPDDAW